MASIRNFRAPSFRRIIFAAVTIFCVQALFACTQNTLESEAASGDVNAETTLGVSYYRNEDWADALAPLMKAANQGDARAMDYLGNTCYYGSTPTGGPGYNPSLPALPNAQLAFVWWRKAANLGNAPAMYSLGMMGYQQGSYKHFFWIKKSAEAGYAGAMAPLGYIYYKGLGTAPDYNKAYYWMKKAAAAGEQNAQGWLLIHPAP